MSDYETRRVNTPPILKEYDGKIYVQIIDGPLTLESEVGPWFLEQIMDKYVLPRLRKGQK